MKKTKITAFLLLAAMLTSVASCGDTSASGNETTTGGGDSAETTPAETGRDAVSDDLPAKNFGGAKFTILDRTDYVYEFEAEEETGDLLNDAIYKRNLAVEDRFGIDLVSYPLNCAWGDQATAFNNTLLSSVMAGDGAFDLVAGYAATIPGIVSEGIFFNWSELDHIDQTKPWWSELVAEELTINGKDFMITGDISLALWKGMNCIFFNKRLAENYQTGDLYALVKDGKWTFDKMAELTKDVYQDIDGDGKRSNGDSYGMLMGWATEIDNMKEAFEIHVTEKGKDGFPEITLVNEHTIEAVGKINDYIHNNDGVYANGDGDIRTQIYNMFSNGQGLMYTATLGKSEQLRAMNDDFGILPYPKYDENQKQYHSTSLDEFSLFVLPIDVKDKEMSAIITEALCAESYKKVVPIFYDTALKTKAARDDASSEMIDLIRDNLTFDFGYLHSNSVNGVGHMFVNWIRNNNNNIASDYDKAKSATEEKLAKVLEIYR